MAHMLEPVMDPAAREQRLPNGSVTHARSIEIDADDLRLRGDAARGLRGSYLCMSPGHGTDDAMAHVLTFDDGRVRYRNRRIPRRVGHTVVPHADRLLTLGDWSLPVELTKGFVVEGDWNGNGRIAAMAPHPKLDPVWDELVWFGASADDAQLVWGVIDPRGRVVRPEVVVGAADVARHDFAVTTQHVAFLDGDRIGVAPRDPDEGSVRWFAVEPRSVGHVLNGYSDGPRLVVDYVRAGPGEPRHAAGGPLWRTVVDLVGGSVSDEVLDDRMLEFPRVDPRRIGVPHRYGFGARRAAVGGDGGFDAIVRWDFRTDEMSEHCPGQGVVVGEPQMVPRSENAREGDGWLLVLTGDAAEGHGELQVLDPGDLDAGPVATVALPRPIAVGGHGTWMPA
ncbi:MAG: carotenoid oxygenase family protein [Actinobacteria bacterium]|nr:carotenoid oxygenase family protein [Actinomycetota bacterium]